MSDPRETKQALRAELRARRRDMPTVQRWVLARAIAQRLDLILPQKGVTIGVYAAVRGELPVAEALLELGGDRRWAWPRTEPATREMTFHLWPRRPDATGAHGIPEPPVSAPLATCDAFVVPGVAFDRAGVRLGSGAGYYDRFFDRNRNLGPRIGVCASYALVAGLPADAWDVRMTHVVTERETLILT